MDISKLKVADQQVAEQIVGGWDPALSALASAQTGYNAGTSLLGAVGGVIGTALGLIGGFITGIFTA